VIIHDLSSGNCEAENEGAARRHPTCVKTEDVARGELEEKNAKFAENILGKMLSRKINSSPEQERSLKGIVRRKGVHEGEFRSHFGGSCLQVLGLCKSRGSNKLEGSSRRRVKKGMKGKKPIYPVFLFKRKAEVGRARWVTHGTN